MGRIHSASAKPVIRNVLGATYLGACARRFIYKVCSSRLQIICGRVREARRA